MQPIKVPGLNIELFSKSNAKEQAADPPPGEADVGPESDKATLDANKGPPSDAGASTVDTAPGKDYNLDVNEALVEHELLWSTQYTYDEFIDSLSVSHEGRGDTPDEKRHWSYPRRWLVKLHNLKIINCVADSLTCFAEFDFGGSRSECRVQMGGSVCILNRGETKNYIRTTVVQNVTKDVPRSFNCTHDFEYRGSYLDLENEKLKIKLWKYRRHTVNCLESVYEGQLLQFAKGDIHVEIPMYKGLNKKRHLRCRISFDLYFQELYDFELSFLGWRLTDVPSFVELLSKGKEAMTRIRPSNTGTGGKGKPRTRMWSNMSFSIFDKLSYYFIRRRLDRDYAKETALMRVTADHTSEGGEGNRDTLDPYKLILQSQSELALKPTPNPNLKNSLPSLKLQLHIRTDSAYRYITTLHLSSLVSRHSKDAYWENMGELIFRGTLLDLERAEIEIDVIDTNAPKAVNKVGRIVLPLSGIVDYPYLKSKLSKPKWLCLKASMEGWGSVLDRINFGSLSGKIQILRQPRYRQLTTPSGLTLYSHPMMLVVTIGGIDQLVVEDDSAEINSYVEISFARMTYRTYICKNNLAPTWNEDILLPFLTNDAEKISSLVLLQRSPMRFTVWGSSNRSDRVIYLGGTVLHLHEIFYTPKGSLKPLVKKTYTEKGGHGNMYDSHVFETRVFSGPLKLSFLNNEEGQSSLTVSVWIYPNIPDEIMPEQFDPKIVRSDKAPIVPYQMSSVYQRLVDDWQKVVELKVRPVFKNVGPLSVECFTQYRQRRYLPSLITPMHPPLGIDTPNAIFHMVRCIPFVRKNYESTFTPEFLMKMKGGDAFDHCILQCSYLRGLIPSVDAYICVGTTQDGRNHAWLATFMPNVNGSVKFWETTTGEIRVLKNRLVNEDCATDSITERRLKLKTSIKMPYRTLVYMFNENNIWLNIQGFTDPQLLLYDVDNTELWYPFSPFVQNMEPTYVPKICYPRINEYDLLRISSEMQQNIERYIITHRYAQNLQTRWNKDEVLNEFLVTGLRLLHQINTCPDADIQLAKCELQEWKMLLNKNIPQSHQVVAVPLHFNTVEAEYIAEYIKTNIPLLDSRERFITFAFASKVISLPGHLYSVYVILLVAQKIHERVRIRLVLEQERIAQRKRKKKFATSMEEDSNEILNRDDSLNDSLKAALEANLEMSGDSWGVVKQYSSLVDVIDNNLMYHDKQLSKLMSNSSTKAGPERENSLTSKTSTVSWAHLDSSKDSMTNDDGDGDEDEKDGKKQVPYEPSMTINFASLDAPDRKPSRKPHKHTGKAKESAKPVVKSSSDVQMEHLMNAPSYEFQASSESIQLKADSRSGSGTLAFGSDVTINSNLLSNRSRTVSGSMNSDMFIGGRSFEMSDSDDISTRFDKRITSNNTSRMTSRDTAYRDVKRPSDRSMPSQTSFSDDDNASTGKTDFRATSLISEPSAYLGSRSSSSGSLNSNLVSRVLSRRDTGASDNLRSSTTNDTTYDREFEERGTYMEGVNRNLISHATSVNSARGTDSLPAPGKDTPPDDTDSDNWSDDSSDLNDDSLQTTTRDPLISDSDGHSLPDSGRQANPLLASRGPSFNEALLSRHASNVSYTSQSVSNQSVVPPELQSDVSSASSPLSPSTTSSSSEDTETPVQAPPPPKEVKRRVTPKKSGDIRVEVHPPSPSPPPPARPRRLTPVKPKRMLPPQIDKSDAFQALRNEASISSTEGGGQNDSAGRDAEYTRRVSFAETATMYSANKSVTEVPTIDTRTPNHNLARFLFDKSKVKATDWVKPPEQHHRVCDFKYVDLFHGFLD